MGKSPFYIARTSYREGVAKARNGVCQMVLNDNPAAKLK